MKYFLSLLFVILMATPSWAFTVYFKDGSSLDDCYFIKRFTPEIYGYDGDKILAKDGHGIHGDEVNVVDSHGKVYDFYWETIDVKQTTDSIREEWQTNSIKQLQLEEKDHENRINNLEYGQKEIEAELAAVNSRVTDLKGQIDSLRDSIDR